MNLYAGVAGGLSIYTRELQVNLYAGVAGGFLDAPPYKDLSTAT
ncbi:hypothetical protein ACSYAD_21030 [Acaryochloris marina NIES-2412]